MMKQLFVSATNRFLGVFRVVNKFNHAICVLLTWKKRSTFKIKMINRAILIHMRSTLIISRINSLKK